MTFEERINVLIQGCEIGQKHGVYSLDDAVEIKNTIESIKQGNDIGKSIESLVKFVSSAQQFGAYSLKDAYLIYSAIDGIDESFGEFIESIKPKLVNDEKKVEE